MSLAPSDFKYAVRLLAKRPWFTALTVIMLAGGLGISLYKYAVLNVMLYRSVPLPEGSSIVKIGAGSWVDIELLDSFELKELRDNASSLGVAAGTVMRPASYRSRGRCRAGIPAFQAQAPPRKKPPKRRRPENCPNSGPAPSK